MIRYAPLLALLCCSQNSAPATTPDERPPSALTTWVSVREASEARLLEASARIVPEPGAAAALSPPLAARLMQFHVRVGDRVTAGARVATVLMPEAVASSGRLLAARTRLAAVGERQRGLEALAKEGFSRIADRIEVQTQMAEATAEEQIAKATLAAAGLSAGSAERLIADEGRVDLRAPFAGIVMDLDGDIGEHRMAGGRPFARIVDVTRLVIEASFTQLIPAGAPATFLAGQGDETAVEWASKSLSADPSSGVFRGYFRLPPRQAWLPGILGRIRVRPEQAWLVVPASALTAANEVVVEAGDVVKVEIISRSAAEVIVHASRLRAGDKVATNPRGLTP